MSDDNKEGAGVPVAEVVNKFGDPEAFAERDLRVLGDIQKLPIGTKLYATPPAVMPAAPSDAVLAALDALGDDSAAHIYPSDLEKCMTSECVVPVASVRVSNPDERSVPLFSREQVAAALSQTMQPQAKRGYLGSTVDGGIDDHDEDRPHQDNPGATQDAGPDAGATGSTSGPGADQHHQHRVGKADDHRACAECNSQGAGVSGESAIREVVAAQKAEPAAGEQAGAGAIINGEPATALSLLDALIDIYDDAENKAPEHRCYVEGAWEECLSEARAFLAAPGAAIAAREQEAKVPKAGSFLMQRIDAAADALSEVLAFQRLNDDRKTKVARALSGLRGMQSIAIPSAALTQPTTVQQEPDPLLIDSMCMRWRHDFGLQRNADDPLSSGFTDAERDSLRSSMRQLWEEVVGRGFYRPAALKGMQPGERKEGV